MSIKFEKVDFFYYPKTPFQFHALKNINIEIGNGDFTAIVGHTGSGKSTLVQNINGLLLPTNGVIKVNDFVVCSNKKTVKFKEIRKNVGLVFQFPEYQLFEETIIKDVMFGPMNFGLKEDEAKNAAIQALQMVGIEESMYEKSPLDISGGQKRRVAIAGILAINPEIIILDEPTAGLDPQGSKEIMNIFTKLNKEYNKTIVLITHDMDVVFEYANRVIAMKDGEVAYNGKPIDLFTDKNKLDSLSLLEPTLLDFALKLNNKGFQIDLSKIKSIDDLSSAIIMEVTK